MDPGTALAVAGMVCEASKGLYEYIRDLKSYEKDNRQVQEHLSWLYAVFKAVHDTLQDGTTSASNQELLRGALMRCWGNALELSAYLEKVKPLEKGKSRTRKLLYPLRKPSVKGIMTQVQACQSELAFAVDLLQLERTSLTIGRIQAVDTKVVIVQARLQSAEDEKKAQRIIDSLSSKTQVARRSIVEDAHAQTFRWIFVDHNVASSSLGQQGRHSVTKSTTTNTSIPHHACATTTDGLPNTSRFARWLGEDGDVFWIRGKAGSGKSTLMKFLLDNQNTRELLRQWASGKKLILAEHFFWVAGDQEQKSKYGMLRNLLRQVLMAHRELVPVVCQARWQSETEAAMQWSTAELVSAMHLTANLPDVRICLFIDALDECNPEHQHKALVQDIFDLALNTNAKITVSSRPWTAFDCALGRDDTIVALEDLTKEDMFRYVRAELTAHSRGQIPNNMDWSSLRTIRSLQSATEPYAMQETAQLVVDILRKADGVFLWVSIVVDHLCRQLCGERPLLLLNQYVDSFPSKLEDYLRQYIFQRIHESWISETAIVLKMVTLRIGRDAIFWLCWVLSQKGSQVFATPDFYLLQEASYLSSNADSARSRVESFLGACCKDLVYVPAAIEEDPDLCFVALRHRTVVDFLETTEMQKTINENLPQHFSDASIYSHLMLISTKACGIYCPSHGLNNAAAGLPSTADLHTQSSAKQSQHHLESLPLRLIEEYARTVLQLLQPPVAEFKDYYGGGLNHVVMCLIHRQLFNYTIAILKILQERILDGPNLLRPEVLAVALGADLGRIFPRRDIDMQILEMLLQAGIDPNDWFWARFNENSSTLTIWQAFLNHQIFRFVQDGHAQPGADCAARHLVEYGASLSAQVWLPRGDFVDEATLAPFGDSSQEGDTCPASLVLKVLFPAHDFQVIAGAKLLSTHSGA